MLLALSTRRSVMTHGVKLLDNIKAFFGPRLSSREVPEDLGICSNVGQEQLRLDLDDSQPLDLEEDHESFYIRSCPYSDFDAMCPDSCFEYQCCQFKDPD